MDHGELPTVADRLRLPDQERHGAGREKADVRQVDFRDRDRGMFPAVDSDGLRVDLADQSEHGDAVTGVDADAARRRQGYRNEGDHSTMVGDGARSNQYPARGDLTG